MLAKAGKPDPAARAAVKAKEAAVSDERVEQTMRQHFSQDQDLKGLEGEAQANFAKNMLLLVKGLLKEEEKEESSSDEEEMVPDKDFPQPGYSLVVSRRTKQRIRRQPVAGMMLDDSEIRAARPASEAGLEEEQAKNKQDISVDAGAGGNGSNLK